MCVECHTTGFQRGYDAAQDTYDSRWEALGVGCQSCHGPASGHLRWAEGHRDEGGGKGFEGEAIRAGTPLELHVCARCHSRRTPLGNGSAHGEELLDAYLPMILTAELYEVDGTIKDEVFEYGSFRQSRMHAAGVGCSDCHDAHSARLRAPGNAVCTQCHGPAATPIRDAIDGSRLRARRYDDPSHHHHATGSAGGECVACHMPGKLYMGNDQRHDHSFTSPHPLEARALSHSDACLGCHRAEEAGEVVAAFQRWYPGAEPRDGGYARALHAARQGRPGAAEGLLLQLAREDLPDIRRATLLSELPNYPSSPARRALIEALRDSSPLVRRTAVELLDSLLPSPDSERLITGLVDDPVRAVRLAASWHLLQSAASRGAPPRDRLELIAEYEEVQGTMLDRAEAHLNLAGVYQLTGREALVEPSLRRALRQDSTFYPALILLAQWREQAAGDPEGASRLLLEALETEPAEASLWHALSLMRVRQGQREEALRALRRAHELAPEHPDYGYALAAALHDSGGAGAALELLLDLSRRHPANRALRLAAIAHLQSAGRQAEADAAWSELAAQNPQDPLLLQRSQTQP